MADAEPTSAVATSEIRVQSVPEAVLHVVVRAHLALAIEIRHMQAMELHELTGKLEAFFPRGRFNHRVTANDLFRFGERTVGDGQLAALRANPHALGCALEPGRFLEPAL